MEGLIKLINDLKAKVGIKDTIKDYGIDEKVFLANLDEMVEQAFDDQCTGANPRYPLMSEIKQMYLNAYYGKHFEEKAMPTAKDLKTNAKPDAIKTVYNKGKKPESELKEESMMKLDRVIAVRNHKTIYRDGEQCVKVFDENYSKSDVLNEALNQARIEETGLRIPKILGVTMVEGKWAIVSEYIKGKTLAQLMEEDEDKRTNTWNFCRSSA